MFSRFLNRIKNMNKWKLLSYCVIGEVCAKSGILITMSCDKDISNVKRLKTKTKEEYQSVIIRYCIVAPIREEFLFRFLPYKLLPTPLYFTISTFGF